ncbi:hypothetical protein QW131_12065 [Roseibium salinum]|nr:hypothetical protein [Roseibium salinum]
MKGQALTLGFPLVGQVAANLCHLIETVPGPESPATGAHRPPRGSDPRNGHGRRQGRRQQNRREAAGNAAGCHGRISGAVSTGAGRSLSESCSRGSPGLPGRSTEREPAGRCLRK